MHATKNDADADLFWFVDRLLKESGRDARGENRNSERFSYPSLQWIAPYDGHRTPKRSEFEEMRCLDLSAGGLSFVTPQSPQGDAIVVSLGPAANPTLVSAKVVRTDPLYVIGCQFDKRLT